MAFKKVVSYSLAYSTANKQFLFNYTLEGAPAVIQFFPTPEEFSALADMFRSEGRTVGISYEDQNNYFVTGELTLP
jgi:hypothetical protein